MTQINSPQKKYGQFALGALLGLLGFFIAIAWFENVLIRTAGIAICLGGAYLIVFSKRRRSRTSEDTRATVYTRPDSADPSRLVWIFGAISLIIAGVCSAFLYRDAVEGYHDVWPVYAFAISMAILAMISSYIVGKLIKNMFTR